MNSRETIVRCSCYDGDHIMMYAYDPESPEYGIFFNTTLNHYLPFWKRIKVAFKYLFGMDNTFQHYAETIMSPEAVQKLKSDLNEWEDLYEWRDERD